MAADVAPSWIHVPDLGPAGGEIVLEGDEAHYLARVVRARAGDRVQATDGRGAIASLELLAIGRETRARVLEARTLERARRLTLWCGAPEGDRADWLIEKLGELGVASLVPVECERGRWQRAGRRRERWDRLARAALRQSCSAWLLEIAEPVSLAEAAKLSPAAELSIVADPAGAPPGSLPSAASEVRGAVGPSGGFSDAELKWLGENGFVPMTLAASRLRTETAALAVGAWWAAGAAPA